MTAAAEATPRLGAASACRALGIARASFYRRRDAENRPSSPRPPPPRKLDDSERKRVLDALHSPEFVDSVNTGYILDRFTGLILTLSGAYSPPFSGSSGSGVKPAFLCSLSL